MFTASQPITSCTGSDNNHKDRNVSVFSSDFSGSKNRAEVTKTLNLSNFSGICVNGGVVVNYTQGKNYKVVFSGTQEVLDKMDFKVRDGQLVVEPKSKWKSGFRLRSSDCRLTITAPDINKLEVNGSCTFNTEAMKTGNMNIEVNGAMTMNGSVVCSAFSLENNGSFSQSGAVKAKTVSMENNGSYTSDVDFNVTGLFDIENSGSGKMSGKIKAHTFNITCDGSENDDIVVEAEKFGLEVNGAGSMDVDFKGGSVDIECDGAFSVDMKVDCRKLTSRVDGMARLKLSGTADQTNLQGDGVSNVDTRGLNKF